MVTLCTWPANSFTIFFEIVDKPYSSSVSMVYQPATIRIGPEGVEIVDKP